MQNNNQPVAWMYSKEDKLFYFNHRDASLALQNGYKETPLYTHLHQWQGVTDDEIDMLEHNDFTCWGRDDLIVFGRAIEAKLKEKNT